MSRARRNDAGMTRGSRGSSSGRDRLDSGTTYEPMSVHFIRYNRQPPPIGQRRPKSQTTIHQSIHSSILLPSFIYTRPPSLPDDPSSPTTTINTQNPSSNAVPILRTQRGSRSCSRSTDQTSPPNPFSPPAFVHHHGPRSATLTHRRRPRRLLWRSTSSTHTLAVITPRLEARRD